MTAEKIDNREYELRRFEAKIGLLKVLIGTALVGLVGIIIPGAIEWWSLGFQERRASLASSIEQEKNRQDFISAYVDTALNQDIELRIRFAEYFAAVSDEESVLKWETYLSALVEKKKESRGQIDAFEKRYRFLLDESHDDPSIDQQIELAYLERRLEWLYREIGYIERGRSIVPSNAEERRQTQLQAAAASNVSPNYFDSMGPLYSAIVVDAATGQVLHASNAEKRLHPASLVKMMTLYIAHKEISLGRLSLETPVLISRFAAAEPPSKLGMDAGTVMPMGELILAASVKSANDAASAIAEHIGGSEEGFIALMNAEAQRLGMLDTEFKNAHGLTQSGQLSTAKDMAKLVLAITNEFPEQAKRSILSTAATRVREVSNTCRRLLDGYQGVVYCKTGYTRAAGFNIAFEAARDGKKVIVVVFGGQSTATRNARAEELADLGFVRAQSFQE